ncbi:hypothetical protein QQ045_016135 [Rhodiola kirilowii]
MSTFRIGFKTSSAADRLYVLKINSSLSGLADPIHLILIPPPILPDLNLRVFVLRSTGAELMSKYGVNVPRGVAVGSTEELKMAIQEQFQQIRLIEKVLLLRGEKMSEKSDLENDDASHIWLNLAESPEMVKTRRASEVLSSTGDSQLL